MRFAPRRTDTTALADAAARAHREGWAKLLDHVGHGWSQAGDFWLAGVTGLPAAPFNGLNVYGPCLVQELGAQLRRIALSGLPCALQTRPGSRRMVAQLARRHGMARQPSAPIMAITAAPSAAAVPGLKIRTLAPEDGEPHARIVAEVFDAPLGLMRQLSSPRLLRAPGIEVLLGVLDGEPVATALLDVNPSGAGIINVATRAGARGRGIGSALTAAAAARAFARGAPLCQLLATPTGQPVYARLGFRELERWSAWVRIPAL
ncbi:MAG TPA: GNAT family N-acetyltransferase [Solirubrobacteraceae bacterium]|nr:GNAT family N-acetyltransferase [Solirubrobacteraceae bacterium]